MSMMVVTCLLVPEQQDIKQTGVTVTYRLVFWRYAVRILAGLPCIQTEVLGIVCLCKC